MVENGLGAQWIWLRATINERQLQFTRNAIVGASEVDMLRFDQVNTGKHR
jgi:hypothetical protein